MYNVYIAAGGNFVVVSCQGRGWSRLAIHLPCHLRFSPSVLCFLERIKTDFLQSLFSLLRFRARTIPYVDSPPPRLSHTSSPVSTPRHPSPFLPRFQDIPLAIVWKFDLHVPEFIAEVLGV